jgi:hypothetical protein
MVQAKDTCINHGSDFTILRNLAHALIQMNYNLISRFEKGTASETKENSSYRIYYA